MPLESATYIDDLNASNPATTDGVTAGDDHIRLVKSVLKATFPSISGAVNVSESTINGWESRISTLESVAGSASAILTSIKTVDGSSSGLDADFLRGVGSNVTAATNSIVQRDGNADIFARYYFTQATAEAGEPTVFYGGNGADNAIREYTAGNVANVIEDNLNASVLLTLIKTVDGTGSGLDADLLDGKTAVAGSATPTTIMSRNSDADTVVRRIVCTEAVGVVGSNVDDMACFTSNGAIRRVSAASTLDYLAGGQAVGAVGTYALLYKNNAGSAFAGDTESGANLRYSSVSSSGLTAPSGTWRCMGQTGGGTGTNASITLWVRIS